MIIVWICRPFCIDLSRMYPCVDPCLCQYRLASVFFSIFQSFEETECEKKLPWFNSVSISLLYSLTTGHSDDRSEMNYFKLTLHLQSIWICSTLEHSKFMSVYRLDFPDLLHHFSSVQVESAQLGNWWIVCTHSVTHCDVFESIQFNHGSNRSVPING